MLDGKRIEVFRVGKHTDSAGSTKEWSEDELKTIASKYDPTFHEAPVVIGHPKDNAPAFGWAKSLEYQDGSLYATLDKVNSDFAQAVEDGAYKKRSISLYPDLSLRHIGLLGAMPPAIKGLEDIAFNEGETYSTYEFEESKNTPPASTNFAETISAQAAKIEQQEAAIDELNAKIQALQDEKTRENVQAFIDSLIADGKVTASDAPFLVNLGVLVAKATNWDFAEAKDTTSSQFEGFLRALPPRVEFSEFATNDKANGKTNTVDLNDRDALHKAALSFAEENSINYSDALNKIIQGAKTNGN